MSPWSTADGRRGLWCLRLEPVAASRTAGSLASPSVPGRCARTDGDRRQRAADAGDATRSAQRRVVRPTIVHNSSVALVDAHLPWLVDRWGALAWLPLANVYSVGDVLIAAGLAIAIVAGSRPRAFGSLLRPGGLLRALGARR